MKYLALTLAALLPFAQAETSLDTLELQDVFTLEYASDVTISKDASDVYFVRNYMDIYKDKKVGNIWKVSPQGELRPVTSGLHADYSPKLSPDGKRLAYLSTASGKSQIHIKWLDTGESSQISHLTQAPGSLTWSPDGQYLAFSAFVPGKASTPVSLPGMPKGAKWAKPATYTDKTVYRFDGAGFAKPGHSQVFVMPATGGSPRQLTEGEFDHGGHLSWSKDGKTLFLAANRVEDADFRPVNSEIYAVDVATKAITALTDRDGPDQRPKVSPDGKWLAYLGNDNNQSNYENRHLYRMRLDGSEKSVITPDFDRSIDEFYWAANNKGFYIKYDDQGDTKVAYQPVKGKRKVLAQQLGGKAFGRPYTGSDFSVANDGTLAYTYSDPLRPADVAISKKSKKKVLTALNEDALAHKTLGKVEELWFKSSVDQLDIQSWVVYPPGFDASKKYPMILEIHGGPVANYGPHFSTEVQLMAAKGYVVLYVNPRGSDSYGKAFTQHIHHNYPSQDYDDLMSGVDALLAKGFVDPEQLYVTGGSGGGTLTAWIVGHTDRFKAAVVAKPVINWYSFVLTSDFYPFFQQHWFGKMPWEATEHYMERSPISYVGNVTTPTMLLTGESDYRTPMSETEQFYQALQLQKVESAMVRIPDAPHGIYRRPSNLMSKVAHILWWFEQYGPKQEDEAKD